MKNLVLELCALGMLSCLLQCILPKGTMKKTAMFACGIVLLSHFLTTGYRAVQNFDYRNIFTVEKTQVQNYETRSVYVQAYIQKILGSNAHCSVYMNREGCVVRIVVQTSPCSVLQKQSITRTLCGIYGIDESAIEFEESG